MKVHAALMIQSIEDNILDYINGKTWEQTAEIINYSEVQLYRLRGKGLGGI